MKKYLSWSECTELAERLACRVAEQEPTGMLYLYGVPRGGIHVAQLMERCFPLRFILTNELNEADYIVDDLIDSGATMSKYMDSRKLHEDVQFIALFDKRETPDQPWYVFPWEVESEEQGPEDNVLRILQYIGEDPTRNGLLETPKRVVKSYDQLFAGYKQDPAELFKCFDEVSDEMVVLRGIEFYSTCEHHMMPFVGTAAIAYIPNQKVIGISKLARLLEVFSRRLQVQERLTNQITEALMEHLDPLGAACLLKAKHFCMCCRGVNKQNSEMITSSLKGAFKDNVATRAEFLHLAY